ncbi:hypothetical protein HDV01_006690 [Terramyces sp. JEL0728]|nr:hypothetical protein HDV01_006690 [Terramyces sp. JEL0728]
MPCSVPTVNVCLPYTNFKLDFDRLSKFYNSRVGADNWHSVIRNTSWMDFLGCDINPQYALTYNCFTDIYVLSSDCNQPQKICDSVCETYGKSVKSELEGCKHGYQEQIDFMMQAESICKQHSSPTDCLSAVQSESQIQNVMKSTIGGNPMDKMDPQYSTSYLIYGSIFGLLVVGALILVAFKLHRKTEEIVLTHRASRLSFSSLAFSTFERPILGKYFEESEEIPLEEIEMRKSADSRMSADRFHNIPLDSDEEDEAPLVKNTLLQQNNAESAPNIQQPFSNTIDKSAKPLQGYPSYPTSSTDYETKPAFDQSYIAGSDYQGNDNELSFQKGDKILFTKMEENGNGEAINTRTYKKGIASLGLMSLDSVREADAHLNPHRNLTLAQNDIFRTHSTLLRSFLLKNVGIGKPEITVPTVSENGPAFTTLQPASSPAVSVKGMFKNPVDIDGVGTGETLLNKTF